MTATTDDPDVGEPVELVALSVKEWAARCHLLGSDNQGVRLLIDEVKAITAWEDRENE